MKRRNLRLAALPVAVILAVGMAACGGDDEGSGGTGSGSTTEVSGNLAGAGASSQGAAMEAWIAGFATAAPDATVTYDPVGSGGGREQFTSGGVQFAGSDAYLKPEEITAANATCGANGFLEMPVYISPIAVAYNLPGVAELQAFAVGDRADLRQKITKWNDPKIAELNQGANLPDLTITAVHRSDESGTTRQLHRLPEPGRQGRLAARGRRRMAGSRAARRRHRRRASRRRSRAARAPSATSTPPRPATSAWRRSRWATNFVKSSPEAAAAVVDAATKVEGRPEHSYAIDVPRDTTAEGVYPIVLVSYLLACAQYEDQARSTWSRPSSPTSSARRARRPRPRTPVPRRSRPTSGRRTRARSTRSA